MQAATLHGSRSISTAFQRGQLSQQASNTDLVIFLTSIDCWLLVDHDTESSREQGSLTSRSAASRAHWKLLRKLRVAFSSHTGTCAQHTHETPSALSGFSRMHVFHCLISDLKKVRVLSQPCCPAGQHRFLGRPEQIKLENRST